MQGRDPTVGEAIEAPGAPTTFVVVAGRASEEQARVENCVFAVAEECSGLIAGRNEIGCDLVPPPSSASGTRPTVTPV